MNSLDFQTLAASLFSQESLAALAQSDYDRLTAALYAAPYSVRMEYAEILFRYNRNVEIRSRGAFLACTVPSAQRLADRLFQRYFPAPPQLTAELFFDGAVRYAIKFFHKGVLPEEVPFRKGLARTLYSGAIRAAFHRIENRRLLRPQIPQNPAYISRLEQQIIARDLLNKLADYEPESSAVYIQRFIQALVDLGPENILIERRYGNRHTLTLDAEPIMQHLGLSLSAVRHYLVDARALLHERFNPDGSLFRRA